MDCIMVKNKRGQGGMSMEMLVGLIAIAVILVLAILFFSGFFNTLGRTSDAQKLDIVSFKEKCNMGASFTTGAAESSQFAAYCSAFSGTKLKIGSYSESYVTCAYLEKSGEVSFDTDIYSKNVKEKCDEEITNKIIWNRCRQIQIVNKDNSKNWKEYLNGRKCDGKSNYTDFIKSDTPDGVDDMFNIEVSFD